MSEDKSSSFQYENVFNCSISDESGNKKPPYPFYCNVWSCYVCHNDQKKLSKEEIQVLKQRRRKNNIYYPKPKRCDGNCNYCRHKIYGNYHY